MTDKKPFEIARETLTQLSARKIAPTPANYQAIYSEVAGIPNEPPFPADRLRDLALDLPARTPGQQKQRGLLNYAISQLDWEGVKNALVAYGSFCPTAAEPAASGTPTSATALPLENAAPALTADFFEQLARLIEYALPALGTDDAVFCSQAQALLEAMRQPEIDVLAVKLKLSNFGNRLSFAAEDQAEIKLTLLKLLQLIITNIGELSLDDRWLAGQIEALLTASAPPLSLRRLDDVERRLKDVIFKQSEAKAQAMATQEEMRQMLATFIARLSQMTESTSAYHSKMEENARLIEQARTIADITPVLKELVGATRSMARDSLTARDELHAMREKSQTTAAELAQLHQELDRVSNQARHDPLTGALNRKGLDEALERELSNVRRKDAPLCLAMLDIDNFKKLNDQLGHATGDEALAHLARVTREVMRPQDSLARYGGEEFVILLPDTPLDHGIQAITRLQHELSKRFFLAGNLKTLITFSAGVAQLAADETGADAIRRADLAMYLAKRAGKNRVVGA